MADTLNLRSLMANTILLENNYKMFKNSSYDLYSNTAVQRFGFSKVVMFLKDVPYAL